MPTMRDWDGDNTRTLVVADYADRHYNAAVRDLFQRECETRGYEVRDSLRGKGLQAWRDGVLVGEYTHSRSSAWFRR